ncbi:Flagellar hook protein FlgE [hydrothermal vent metagenome]|uniref:Flagellar hook protein FlgE n=1 Tax=hydrothermal vent metagenome TaxID=652676 RepID=A0A1W1D5K2_9ZZZZ
MMVQAFYTGISGLKSNQSAIDVESDNIANINTTGFRASNPSFASLFSKNINTPNTASNVSSEEGLGTRMYATADMIQTQGARALTDRNTDLAIDGDGWFGVQNGDETFYTRAGDFVFDKNNDLVTADGMYVLGTMTQNIQNNVLTKEVSETKLGPIDTQQKLRFPKFLYYPPVPTTTSSFFGNLNTTDSTREFGATVIDPQNNKNNLKLTFTKSKEQIAPGVQWDVVAKTISSDGERVYDTQEGKVFFDEKGALLKSTLTTIDNNGAKVNIDLGKDFTGLISVNGKTTNASSKSDGVIGGELEGYQINRNAEVIATFTNGKQSSVGKIALYHFQNDQGLEKISNTRYKVSSNSGQPLFYQDQNGQDILGATVHNFQLERSNVLLENSLTNLIVLQRSFDANSKTITTADQMIQKALSMDAS